MKSTIILIASILSVSGAPIQEDRPRNDTGNYYPKTGRHWGVNSTQQSPDTELKRLLVSAEGLANKTAWDELMRGLFKLQSFASAAPPYDRAFGGPAHVNTINYLYDEVNALGTYDVFLQEQTHLWTETTSSLNVNGTDYIVRGSTHAPNGEATAYLVHAYDLGCSALNFPAEISGNIALIRRGNCSLSEKVSFAGNAGAVGAVIYNNMQGSVEIPLGNVTDPMTSYGHDSNDTLEATDHYVPTVFLSEEDGLILASRIASRLTAKLSIVEAKENRTTYNVIAQTKGGDPDNVVVLGAHTDSVNGASGLNDNGSGTIGLLGVAKALSSFSVKNAVRFCWWTAGEYGQLGSSFYVNNLDDQELAKISMYLNFDMIASINYRYKIYDGDGSAFETNAPTGSAEIEALFEKFYDEKGLSHSPQDMGVSSDHSEFIKKGIPTGGIHTGSYENKTKDEAGAYWGEADAPYDPCYHKQCDTMLNIYLPAFAVNADAIAYAVGTYARSLASIPSRLMPQMEK